MKARHSPFEATQKDFMTDGKFDPEKAREVFHRKDRANEDALRQRLAKAKADRVPRKRGPKPKVGPTIWTPPDHGDLIARWSTDYWSFLTSQVADEAGVLVPVVLTKDEKIKQFRGFPTFAYLHDIADTLMQEQVVFIDKSRQMLVTNLMMLLCLWDLMFSEATRIVLSKSTEDDADELLEDKVVGPYNRLPEWLKHDYPMERKRCKLSFPKGDNYMLGLPQNVAVRARGGTASRTIVDEAAYQDQLKGIITAILPMDTQLWLCSTPGDAGPGAMTWLKYVGAAVKGEKNADNGDETISDEANEPD